jgi:adenylyltransferase/sulfurtransferase
MSTVLIVGAGALGGPIALGLAAAGPAQAIDRLRVCDPDAVELSNLHRQLPYLTADVGAAKVERLANHIAARGSAIAIEPRRVRFEPATSAALLDGVDLAIDGSDDVATKFLVNDAALARGIPAVIAAAIAWRGQVVTAVPGAGCYRCLFEAPPARDPGRCAQIGVIGAACGVIAGEAVRAALALLGGHRPEQVVIHDDVAAGPRRAIAFDPRPGCAACAFGSSPSPSMEAS